MKPEELNEIFDSVDQFIFDTYRDGTITRNQALSVMRKVQRRLDDKYILKSEK